MDKESVALITASAEKGVAWAQYDLGILYETGQGVPKDAVEAVKWWKLAEKQGYPSAEFNLDIMYFNGEGVPT
jgi:TPR repeat protein